MNAVYLKANWVVEFIDGETAPRAFHAPSGVVDVPTMTLRGGQEVPYVAGDGWKATELRYRGKDGTYPLAMTLIMPDDMAAFERGLSGAQVGKIAASLQKERTRLTNDITGGPEDDCGSYPYSLNLFMPRFDVDTRAQLKNVLAGLGMPDAFDAGLADFSGITRPARAMLRSTSRTSSTRRTSRSTRRGPKRRPPPRSAGTPAAAPGHRRRRSSSSGSTTRSSSSSALRDLDTGAILFAGRVLDPSAKR